MRKIVYIILLAIILQFPFAKSAWMSMPVGIAGRVIIDGIPTNGIEVVVQNLNTGETIQTYTRKAQSEDGWFVCAVGGKDGDIIKATVNYNGKSYSKQITVDLNRTTHYINFTISASNPPSANFIWTPTYPKVNETVTFIDTSSDPDGDIASANWNIAGHNFTGHEIQYTFTEPGNFTISLIIMDSKGYIDICEKTIYIAPLEPSFSTNETSISNQTEKTDITLFIEVKDKNGNPLPNTKVEIYRNNTLVQIVYTNEDGTAEVQVQPGSYKIQAFYGSQTAKKMMSFSNNGRVVFLFNPKYPREEHSINYYPLILVVVAIAVVVGVIIKIKKNKKWWENLKK